MSTWAPINTLAPYFPPERGGRKALLVDEGEVVLLTYLGTTSRGPAFLAEAQSLAKPKPVRLSLELLTDLWNKGKVFIPDIPRPWVGA